LWILYGIVKKECPDLEAQLKKEKYESEPARAPARPPQKKKNKPMSSTEQERNIKKLKDKQLEFERHGSGSQEPVQANSPLNMTMKSDDNSSGDEDSDSEEE
jgi:bromodomain-containing factor 1